MDSIQGRISKGVLDVKTAKELIKITFFNVSRALCLAIRPSATGGHSVDVPPKSLLVPPKRRLCPEEINRQGATEVQTEP